MGDAVATTRVSHGDYLAIERESEVRHEWLDGRVYAMAGGTLEHSALAVALAAELVRLARPCGCTVLNSDGRVRVVATGLATYPDASVVCGAMERDPDDPDAVTNPAILVEVLSDSTEGYDRGEKFAYYRQIASLRDYVLVSQHARRIEVYSRGAAGGWTLHESLAGGAVRLTALPGGLEVDTVYGGIALTPAPWRSPTAR